MNQQEFSRATGIAPASLSSIFTGRTSPTLKHAEALHQHFPDLNMSWLLFGDGEMMVSSDHSDASTASDSNNSTDSSYQSFDTSTPGFNFPDMEGSASSVPVHGYSSKMGTMGATSLDAPQSASVQPQIPLDLLKKLDTKPRKIAEIRIFFDDGTYEVFKGNI